MALAELANTGHYAPMNRYCAAMLAVVALLAGCSSDVPHTAGSVSLPVTAAAINIDSQSTSLLPGKTAANNTASPTTTESAASASPATSVLPSPCGLDKDLNAPAPDQVVPDVPPTARITGLYESPYPEGVNRSATANNADPRFAAVFPEAAALVPLPLPHASPQGCCDRLMLRITIENMPDALYGPCSFPDSIERVIKVLSAADR